MNKLLQNLFKSILLTSLFFGWDFNIVLSQSVSGQVMDAGSGERLPGVNIRVKETTTGSSANNENQYDLSATSLKDTLIFSFIGYQLQEVPINGSIDSYLQVDSIQFIPEFKAVILIQ